MKITPLDIVSMIAIASIVISAYAAARVSKGQKAKQGKDRTKQSCSKHQRASRRTGQPKETSRGTGEEVTRR